MGLIEFAGGYIAPKHVARAGWHKRNRKDEWYVTVYLVGGWDVVEKFDTLIDAQDRLQVLKRLIEGAGVA